MPRIAVRTTLTVNNNSLPDFWEFFYLAKTGWIDKISSALSTIPPQRESNLKTKCTIN